MLVVNNISIFQIKQRNLISLGSPFTFKAIVCYRLLTNNMKNVINITVVYLIKYFIKSQFIFTTLDLFCQEWKNSAI